MARRLLFWAGLFLANYCEGVLRRYQGTLDLSPFKLVEHFRVCETLVSFLKECVHAMG